MPKGFTEAEKERIRAAILREGRQLFGQYGLRKTSIGEITSAVGISQGAFYLFFGSKEALYFKILEEEEVQIKQELTKTIPANKEAVKRFLLRAFEIADSNPFFRQVTDDNMMELFRKLPPEELEAHFNRDYLALKPILEAWHRMGLRIPDDPEVLSSLFRAIFMLTCHKKEIGEALYPKTISLLIDLLVEGLFK